jgi:hypothetical protein
MDDSPNAPAAPLVMPCPLLQRYAVEILVVGDDDVPLPAMGVELRSPAGKVLRSKTSRAGIARFDGLEQNSYQFSLFQLDQDAWQLLGQAPLPPAEAASQGDAPWQAPPGAPPGEAQRITAVQGDSVASLAERVGALPRTLWEAPENAALRTLREDANILLPGDVVTVPAIRSRQAPATLGMRHSVRRLGVPEVLTLRFLDSRQRPRAHLPYRCAIDNARGQFSKSREGKTDQAGVLREPVPLDATMARITLLAVGADEEYYEIELGHIDPIDTLSGIQARLKNLGLYGGAADGVASDDTREALRAFQARHDLPPSGEPDAATIARLRSSYIP